jgi:glycosyltransferase involved in cell wall biosynthesis
MNIAINGSFWNRPTTGSGQYIRALHAELVRSAPDNEYVIIADQSQYVGKLQSWLASINENLAKVWFEQIAFRNACARERATLAHVPYFGPPLFPSIPTIVTIHDLIPMLLPLYRGSLLVRAYTQLAAASARRADAIIADSECSKRDIVSHLRIDPARVHVVYLAADARYRPVENAAEIESVRRKYKLPDKYLLYLGGYDQRKNVPILIQACARLGEFYKAGYRLALAGVKLGEDSAFFPDPRRIARQAGLADDAICYVGGIDEIDKPAVYAGAQMFLFPSVYEGFGLPPLEALACGTPVICSNASSLPEVVGAAAVSVNPNSVDAWADAIRIALTDETRRAEMRERGIAQAKQFSWARTAQETLAVYEKAAG